MIIIMLIYTNNDQWRHVNEIYTGELSIPLDISEAKVEL